MTWRIEVFNIQFDKICLQKETTLAKLCNFYNRAIF